jgi:hypothetical protein
MHPLTLVALLLALAAIIHPASADRLVLLLLLIAALWVIVPRLCRGLFLLGAGLTGAIRNQRAMLLSLALIWGGWLAIGLLAIR